MISLSPLPVFKDTDLNNDLPALLLTTLSPFRTLPPGTTLSSPFPNLGSLASGVTLLITLAGFPTTTQKSSTSFVTTLPAPTVTPLPIVTPGNTIAFPPNQQSSPTVMGAPDSGPLVPLRRNGSSGWTPEKKLQFGPTSVRAPMVMGQVSMNVQAAFMNAPLPRL